MSELSERDTRIIEMAVTTTLKFVSIVAVVFVVGVALGFWVRG